MIKSRLAFLDPVLLTRLRTTSRRFTSIKARLRTRIQALQTAEIEASPRPAADPCDHEITVASYNIHKCVGTDGRFDPARIAAVIGELGADVVAVQEADERFGRRRGLLDLKALKKETGLSLLPTSQAADGHGWHGNALLMKEGKVKACAGWRCRAPSPAARSWPTSICRAARCASLPRISACCVTAGAGRCGRSSMSSRRARDSHPLGRRFQRVASRPAVVAACAQTSVRPVAARLVELPLLFPGRGAGPRHRLARPRHRPRSARYAACAGGFRSPSAQGKDRPFGAHHGVQARRRKLWISLSRTSR